MSVNLTLVLTAVAFKFVVSQNLPNISYLTLLDKYVLTSFVMLFIVVVENAVVAKLSVDLAAFIDLIVCVFHFDHELIDFEVSGGVWMRMDSISHSAACFGPHGYYTHFVGED
jgi:hypothetical protein